MMLSRTRFPLVALLLLTCAAPFLRAAASDPNRPPERGAVRGKIPTVPPTPAAEAAKKFRVLDGFRMDLLAAEPLVASPVAMAYDENGRAFVCEMRDYPYTDKAHHVPNQENPTDQSIGRIRLLEDTDGDGVFDKSTVFADGLSWPTGVACWQGGIFVTATPDLWYFKDTDGDGVADVRQKIYTGFKKLNVQAVINNPVWGLDNRLHIAGGSNGGSLRRVDQPDAKPIALARHDFALDPVTHALELESGGARFGGTFDDWGHRFVCNLRNPAQHVVLPLRYLARNPYLPARSPLNDIAEAGDQLPVYPISQPEPWRAVRAQRWAGERDIVMPRSELVAAGSVTSAGGITAYRGAAYPEKYRGNLFITECAGNLLYRLELTPNGASFKATRVDGRAEMVASTDNWFRPVNFVNAPDGTLHVLDMYRENIEHPWSIPDDIHAAVDLEAGRDMGRLWRLTPPNFSPPKPPRLGRATTAELVATLENPNTWWRETAQRLLFERQDKSAVQALRALARESKLPQARLHALWTLQGLNSLVENEVLAALHDSDPGVRENAVRLAEFLHGPPPASITALARLADDSDPHVRLQIAFTAGRLPNASALPVLATLAARDAADPWARTAILSSAGETAHELVGRLAADLNAIVLMRELAQIVGARGKPAEIQALLTQRLNAADSTREIIQGLGEGLKRSAKNLRHAGVTDDAARVIDNALTEAARVAGSSTAPLTSRTAAVHLLTFDEFDRVKTSLATLLAPAQPQEIQRAAVAALGSFAAPETATLLLSHWATQTPAVRADVVAAMLAARSRVLPLLQAVERGTVAANQIPFASRRALLRNTDAQVRTLAEKLFGDEAPRPRKDVIEKYRPALDLRGDAAAGRKIFETVCIACHRAGDLGTSSLGPNLASVRAWNTEQLLVNILDPNREVAPAYVAYTVETKDGRTVAGMIAAESADSLTLTRADGGTENIPRTAIAQMSGLGQSLMPEGLEAAISPQQMADLFAFLRQK